jgi:multidrug efflux pump subunit AcrA (membrane-fusion protein)
VSWTAEEGVLIKEGEPVVKLDPSTVEKDLVKANLEFEQAKLELEEESIRAQDDVEDAQAEVKRKSFDLEKKKLLVTDYDSVSAKEKQKQKLEVAAAKAALQRAKDKVQTTKDRAKKRVAVKELRLKRKSEEAEDLQSGLEKLTLKAPKDGLLIFPPYRHQGNWQKARPGASARVSTIVAELANPDNLVAKLYIPEVDAEGLQKGTTGVLNLDIDPDLTIEGVIERISNVPSTYAERNGMTSNSAQHNIREFEVLFSAPKLPPSAMPGMTVRVSLRPQEINKTLRVPIDALATTPIDHKDESKTKPYQGGKQAFVYGKDSDGGDYKWHEVKIGKHTTNWVEIKQGLSVGDKVRRILW